MKRLLLLILFISTIGVNSSFAVPIVSTDGIEGLGSFTGDFEFLYTSDIAAQIVLSLTNTSPADNGGYLVAFAFNNPGDLITGVTLTLSDTVNDFELLGISDDGVKAAPFGYFDLGSSAANSFLGGGSPNGGLGVGVSGTFTFNLTGTHFTSLSNQDFFLAYSADSSSGQEQWFAARFRGFEDGGSDKVPAAAPVPEPATILLIGTGMVGLAGLRRHKPKK